MSSEPPKLVILAPGEWLGEPHSGWAAVEYRGKIVALFFSEAWRVLDEGLQIIAFDPKDVRPERPAAASAREQL